MHLDISFVLFLLMNFEVGDLKRQSVHRITECFGLEGTLKII